MDLKATSANQQTLIITIFRYDEIRNVSFERSGGSTRSFDISVLTNNDISYTFSSIEKNEYQKLYDYFKNKKITVKAQGSGGKGGTLNFDEDDKVDHYLEGKNTAQWQKCLLYMAVATLKLNDLSN